MASHALEDERGPGSRDAGDEQRISRLRPYNLIVGLIHLAQAIAVLWLSNDFALPITGTFSAGEPGAGFQDPEVIWDVPIGPLVAVFLFLAALDHLLMAAPGIWHWYVNNLRRGINYARWWEYTFSASIMIVLIALITGVSDTGAIIAIVGANIAMIFFGLDMEIVNRNRDNVNWSPFLFGCVAGIVPWIVIAFQFIGTETRLPEGMSVPGFVYGIVISLFILFNSFAINMVLQYKKVGPWRNYLFGEAAYVLLSLTAKTALAWQVFTATLID
jgi:hypothetical protein